MSLVLTFLPEAFAELECATGDYEARSIGLGVRFRCEIESACAAIRTTIIPLDCWEETLHRAFAGSEERATPVGGA